MACQMVSRNSAGHRPKLQKGRGGFCERAGCPTSPMGSCFDKCAIHHCIHSETHLASYLASTLCESPRTTALLACMVGLLALLFLQETTITRWARRLSPQLSVYTTNFSQYPQDIVLLDGESDGAEPINVAAFAHPLSQRAGADDHSLFAENERMLRDFSTV
ncbi:hypothetical protein MIND_00086500 [Mycena indigotica]|uniref:Uncharacterized protein n=1 Tax=Mycena indigotica TaxID=2126181 RepID=A0A8H6TEB3_9AGAR|nr:uncharacterized protein MIND_00086500 [Mycena indigotica]KAF7315709.1 hypothetical protein MIND_00086500 [Mycena indigotica]